MNLLSDTHTFPWFVGGSSQLSLTARQLIEDPKNTNWLSIASLWEMAIKFSLGKLEQLASEKPFAEHIADLLAENAYQVLSIRQSHVTHVVKLPFHHRDPFDRLLVAQSQIEAMPILSADRLLDPYGIQRLW